VANFVVTRIDVRFEQRVNIKFCVKLGKTATETFQLLRDTYGDEALSQARVVGWHRRFVLGRVSVEDDTISGRPSSSRNEHNVVPIRDMIREDRTVTVRILADALHNSKSTSLFNSDVHSCNNKIRHWQGTRGFPPRPAT
jgi:hypothetical protein